MSIFLVKLWQFISANTTIHEEKTYDNISNSKKALVNPPHGDFSDNMIIQPNLACNIQDQILNLNNDNVFVTFREQTQLNGDDVFIAVSNDNGATFNTIDLSISSPNNDADYISEPVVS